MDQAKQSEHSIFIAESNAASANTEDRSEDSKDSHVDDDSRVFETPPVIAHESEGEADQVLRETETLDTQHTESQDYTSSTGVEVDKEGTRKSFV